MFKIIEFSSTPDGKSRFKVETDDISIPLLLRLFSQADKFAQLLHYRHTTESRLEASRIAEPEKMARLRENRARMLMTFREIPGTRSQKLKILQEMCIGDGVNITQDRLSAQLQIALEEEKEGQKFTIKRLIKKGKSLGDIASALDLPKSTVGRIARSLRGASKRDARVKRPVLALADRPPGPFSSSPPVSNPASIPPGRPESA